MWISREKLVVTRGAKLWHQRGVGEPCGTKLGHRCGVWGAQKLCTEADFGRLYSKFYPDKLLVGLQDAVVRAIIILAGGNRGKR